MKKIIALTFLPFVIFSCGTESSNDQVDGVSSSDHRIFITSTSYTGNMSGLTGADKLCQSSAENAGLKLTYKAILSSSSLDVSNAQRLSLSGSIYKVDVSGQATLVASTGSALWNTENNDQVLLGVVDLDENGGSVSNTPWTGTSSEGTAYSDTCSDWTSTSGNSMTGLNTAVGGEWLENDPTSLCSNSYPIYCISQ